MLSFTRILITYSPSRIAVGFLILFALWVNPSRAEIVDVTKQVSVDYSGLVFNRTTQTFDTTVTLINSLMPITSPVSLVISSISTEEVTLANASGMTVDGKPYINVPLSANQLLPGQSVNGIVLKFRNPSRVSFTFTNQVTAQVIPVTSDDSTMTVVGQSGQTITLPGVARLVVPAGAVESAAIEVSRAAQPLFDEALARVPDYQDLQLPRLRVKSSVALNESVFLMVEQLLGPNRIPAGFELKALLLFQDEYGTPIVSGIPAKLCEGGTFVCVELIPGAFKPVPADPTDPIVEIMFVAVPRTTGVYSLWSITDVQPADNSISDSVDVTFEAKVKLRPAVNGNRQNFITSPVANAVIGGSAFLANRKGLQHLAIDLRARTPLPVSSAHDGRYSTTYQAEGTKRIDNYDKPSPVGCAATKKQADDLKKQVADKGFPAACKTPPAGVSETMRNCFILCVCDDAKKKWKVANGVEGAVSQDNLRTNYLHLQSHSAANNDPVDQGDEIATSGNTGNSCDPHLHFEVKLDHVAVDPRPLVFNDMSQYLLRSDQNDGDSFEAPILRLTLWVDRWLYFDRLDTLRIADITNSPLSRLTIDTNKDPEIHYRSPPIALKTRLMQAAQAMNIASDDLLDKHDVRLELTLEAKRLGWGYPYVLHEWQIKGKPKLQIGITGTGRGEVASLRKCKLITHQSSCLQISF